MCDRCGDARCSDPDSKWCSDILLMRYKAEADALLLACDGIVQMAEEAYSHWDNDRDSKVGKMLCAIAAGKTGYDARADAFHAALRSQDAAPEQDGKK